MVEAKIKDIIETLKDYEQCTISLDETLIKIKELCNQ